MTTKAGIEAEIKPQWSRNAMAVRNLSESSARWYAYEGRTTLKFKAETELQ